MQVSSKTCVQAHFARIGAAGKGDTRSLCSPLNLGMGATPINLTNLNVGGNGENQMKMVW